MNEITFCFEREEDFGYVEVSTSGDDVVFVVQYATGPGIGDDFYNEYAYKGRFAVGDALKHASIFAQDFIEDGFVPALEIQEEEEHPEGCAQCMGYSPLEDLV